MLMKGARIKTKRERLTGAAIIFGAVCRETADELQSSDGHGAAAAKLRELDQQFTALYQEAINLIPREDNDRAVKVTYQLKRK